MLDFVWKIQSNYLFALNFGYSAAYSYPPHNIRFDKSVTMTTLNEGSNQHELFCYKITHVSYCVVVIDKTIPVFIKVGVWSVYLII